MQNLASPASSWHRRSSGVALVVAVIVAVTLVVLAALAFGTATSGVSSDAGFPTVAPGSGSSPPADGSYGLVHGGFVREGFGIFGWDIVRPEYRILVMFVPPAGCTPPLTGDLAATGDCAGIPAEGEISGGGTTADGDPLVGVALDVSKACYEALETGARWPSTLPECR